jgi:hypothetical protein
VIEIVREQLLLPIERSIELRPRPDRAERAPVVALVGDVHDDLARTASGGEALIERPLEPGQILRA